MIWTMQIYIRGSYGKVLMVKYFVCMLYMSI